LKKDEAKSYFISYITEGDTVFGVGSSEEEALDDAQPYSQAERLQVISCTSRLYEQVIRIGGDAPDWQNARWEIRLNGTPTAVLVELATANTVTHDELPPAEKKSAIELLREEAVKELADYYGPVPVAKISPNVAAGFINLVTKHEESLMSIALRAQVGFSSLPPFNRTKIWKKSMYSKYSSYRDKAYFGDDDVDEYGDDDDGDVATRGSRELAVAQFICDLGAALNTFALQNFAQRKENIEAYEAHVKKEKQKEAEKKKKAKSKPKRATVSDEGGEE
jgi:hypothetical protein